MDKLIGKGHLGQNRVTQEEADAFNPTTGPCCQSTTFRVHLGGTTCNVWNKSAMGVFVNDFLGKHSGYPSCDESVRDMVLMKSRATLDSMIRKYKKSLTPSTVDQSKALKQRKNRQERKRKVCFFVSSSYLPAVTGLLALLSSPPYHKYLSIPQTPTSASRSTHGRRYVQ